MYFTSSILFLLTDEKYVLISYIVRPQQQFSHHNVGKSILIQAIDKFIYLQSAVFIMVHYMSSYLGICLKLSGTQGATG